MGVQGRSSKTRRTHRASFQSGGRTQLQRQQQKKDIRAYEQNTARISIFRVERRQTHESKSQREGIQMNPNMVFVRNSLKAVKTSVKTHESWRLFKENGKETWERQRSRKGDSFASLRAFPAAICYRWREGFGKAKEEKETGGSRIEDTVGAVASKYFARDDHRFHSNKAQLSLKWGPPLSHPKSGPLDAMMGLEMFL